MDNNNQINVQDIMKEIKKDKYEKKINKCRSDNL